MLVFLFFCKTFYTLVLSFSNSNRKHLENVSVQSKCVVSCGKSNITSEIVLILYCIIQVVCSSRYCLLLSNLFTMGFFSLCSHGGGRRGGWSQSVQTPPPLKISNTKNDLSVKLSSQKHVSFVSIVCLFSCLVCVT